MQIEITGATVLRMRYGTDMIRVHTDLPCPYTPSGEPEQSPLVLQFYATTGTAADYCRNHLGIEPKIIDSR